MPPKNGADGDLIRDGVKLVAEAVEALWDEGLAVVGFGNRQVMARSPTPGVPQEGG